MKIRKENYLSRIAGHLFKRAAMHGSKEKVKFSYSQFYGHFC